MMEEREEWIATSAAKVARVYTTMKHEPWRPSAEQSTSFSGLTGVPIKAPAERKACLDSIASFREQLIVFSAIN